MYIAMSEVSSRRKYWVRLPAARSAKFVGWTNNAKVAGWNAVPLKTLYKFAMSSASQRFFCYFIIVALPVISSINTDVKYLLIWALCTTRSMVRNSFVTAVADCLVDFHLTRLAVLLKGESAQTSKSTRRYFRKNGFASFPTRSLRHRPPHAT